MAVITHRTATLTLTLTLTTTLVTTLTTTLTLTLTLTLTRHRRAASLRRLLSSMAAAHYLGD